MSDPIDRLARAALIASVMTVGLAVPSGLAAPLAPDDAAGGLQLAQGTPQPAPRAGAPQRQAPQAAAPAPAQPGAAGPGIDRQIAELHKRLAITPAQQPQFDAFAQAMQQNTQTMNELLQQEQQNPKRNAVDDLRAAAKFAEAEADGLKRLLPSLQALYDSLSDQQKRTADQVLGNSGQPAEPKGKRR